MTQICNKDLDQDLYKDQGKDKNYQLWLNLDKNLDQDLVNTVSTSGKTTKSLNWMTHQLLGTNTGEVMKHWSKFD